MKPPSPDLPDLRVVPTSGLHPHEHPDEQRAQPLVEALRVDGVLKNPPIVLPIEDDGDEHVVLDGANRVTALQMLGLPHALVQVAHPNGDQLDVKTWNHVLIGEPAGEVLSTFQSLNGFELRAASREQAAAALEAGESLVNLLIPEGTIYKTHTGEVSLEARIKGLDEFVSAYAGRVSFERTSASVLEGLWDVYPDLSCLVVFPSFRSGEVVEGATKGWHFPPGITRFIISPRALRVNYPLDRLASESSQEQKQAELDEWIRERKRSRRVRYYAESTFLFDE